MLYSYDFYNICLNVNMWSGRSTLSFAEEVKLSALSRKILRHVKELYEYEREMS
jgi:hypothetical protein